jgi:hypothetical protein
MKLKTASICTILMLLAATAAFIIRTAGADPNYEVDFISIGPNSYGYPSPDTTPRLVAAGANVWRTDESEVVSMIGDDVSYTIYPESGLTDLYVYLTTILRSQPTPTPTEPIAPPADTQVLPSTETPTTTPTPTPTATLTPTATNIPVRETGNVEIIEVFFDGSGSQEPDEYVAILNVDNFSIQLQGWTLRDNAALVYTFPSFEIHPFQACRVYTNEDHPGWCGFSYDSATPIWNDNGDTATLRDGNGTLIDRYTYPIMPTPTP